MIKICLNNRFIIYTKVKPILTINSEPLIFVNISLFLYSRRYFEGFFRFFFFILINCMTDMYISWTFIPCNIRVTSTDLSWILRQSSEFQLHQKPVLFCIFASSDRLKRLWRASMELISRFMHVYFYFISFITMNNKLSKRCFLKYINRFWE